MSQARVRIFAFVAGLVIPATGTWVRWEVAKVKFPWVAHFAIGVAEFFIMFGFGYTAGHTLVRFGHRKNGVLIVGTFISVGVVAMAALRAWLVVRFLERGVPDEGTMPLLSGLLTGALLALLFLRQDPGSAEPLGSDMPCIGDER